MGITFIGMASRSSGKVRGLQLVDNFKNYNFFDTVTRRFTGKDSFFQKNIVFVRNFDLNLAKSLKLQGRKIGYDIIDKPVAELHRLQLNNPDISEIDWNFICNDFIDFYIVTNTLAKQKLEAITNKEVFIIPHHAVSNKLIEKDTAIKPKTIGYVGVEDQLFRRNEIISYCDMNKLSFYENHPKTQNLCIEDLKKIDIGVVYLDVNNRTDYVLKYKPNQKLSNFQCFGIPSVIVGYNSYIEFGGNNSYLLAKNEIELIENLDMLFKDKDLRGSIQKNGYEAAEKLLVNNVIKLYNFIE